ncbi:MAG: AI-2E family transporter [Chloroflexi bacterium]|nr:AI-2E family transporter [Chloroflexota bacterium]
MEHDPLLPVAAATPPMTARSAAGPPSPEGSLSSYLTPRDRRLLTILLTLGSIALFFVVINQLAAVWAVFGDLVLTFFFAWLLGFILEPIAGWLARFMPRVVAVTIAYGSVALAAFGLVVVAASALFASISDFLANLEQFQQDLIALIKPISDWLAANGFDQVDLTAQVETLLGTLALQAQGVLGPLQDVAVASVGFVGNVLVVFFLAIFISIDRAAIGSFLMRLVPPAYGGEAHLLTESVGKSFGGFIRGMVVIGGTYALVALLCNVLLGLEYAALTTATAGILMAIPFFGPFVAWSPPVIVAAVTQPDALVPAIAIMGIGWFVNQNILQPRVLANAVGLHPVVVLASVLLGTKLFGIAGALFGLPVAAVISSFFFYFLRRNVNPDERSVAARAAQRLSEREGRPRRVPREPRPGEEEEILAEEIGLQVDAEVGATRGDDGAPSGGPDAVSGGADAAPDAAAAAALGGEVDGEDASPGPAERPAAG